MSATDPKSPTAHDKPREWKRFRMFLSVPDEHATNVRTPIEARRERRRRRAEMRSVLGWVLEGGTWADRVCIAAAAVCFGVFVVYAVRTYGGGR